MWEPYNPGSETNFTEDRVISRMMAVCEKPREYLPYTALWTVLNLPPN